MDWKLEASMENFTSRLNTTRNVTAILLQRGFDVESWFSLGLCTVEQLDKLDEFWLRFDAPPYIYNVILAICYSVICIVGLIGNCSVYYLMVRERKLLRKPFNLMLLNLATSDLSMTLKSITVVINSLYAGPAMGKAGCEMFAFCTGVSGITTILTWAMIARDRQVALCRPMDLTAKLTRRQAAQQIALCWAVGFFFSSVPLMGIPGIDFTPEAFLTTCSFGYTSENLPNKIFFIIFFFVAWLAPCMQICYSYTRIYLAMRKSYGEGDHGENGSNPRRYTADGEVSCAVVNIRLAKMSFGLISLWFFSWTPYAIVALIGVFGFKEVITPLGTAIPGVCCKMAACVDPFVYTICHSQFQKAAYTHLPWVKRLCCQKPEAGGPETMVMKRKSNRDGNGRPAARPTKHPRFSASGLIGECSSIGMVESHRTSAAFEPSEPLLMNAAPSIQRRQSIAVGLEEVHI